MLPTETTHILGKASLKRAVDSVTTPPASILLVDGEVAAHIHGGRMRKIAKMRRQPLIPMPGFDEYLDDWVLRYVARRVKPTLRKILADRPKSYRTPGWDVGVPRQHMVEVVDSLVEVGKLHRTDDCERLRSGPRPAPSPRPESPVRRPGATRCTAESGLPVSHRLVHPDLGLPLKEVSRWYGIYAVFNRSTGAVFVDATPYPVASS